ncbi:MgtC/SapB family protein [Roseiarcus sp.]|jgi:putative Mg2+ transporter-C (MgtC) family protein|uniref:MgtC/SapB family protein n=1 Tax=Roseiarcus sp. TaxID=1969460 RepID=UPI003D0FD5EA
MPNYMLFGEPIGQSWVQLSELALAFVLSALIGLEREIRQKSAGLRTYTLVGVSSALIMLISKYGFTDIIENGRVVLDPSRVAAQIVTGIGFIGGGVIFVRKDLVRGLTTASIVWLTAAVGMAAGAGLPILAIAVTCAHFIVVFIFPAIERNLPKSRWAPSPLHISYEARRGALREILAVCTNQEFSVSRVQVEGKPPRGKSQSGAQAGKGRGTGWEDHPEDADEAQLGDLPSEGIVSLLVEVRGARPVGRLTARLNEIAGVTAVRVEDRNHGSE